MLTESNNTMISEEKISAALEEADRQAISSELRYDFDEVAARLRKKITDKIK